MAVASAVVLWVSPPTSQVEPLGRTQGLPEPQGAVVPTLSLLWMVMTFAPMDTVLLVCQSSSAMCARPVYASLNS